MSLKSKCTVLIVGAGPVGLLTALRLGQAGISTLVIESHTSLLPTTRAMVYMPVVVPVLRSLGIMDVVANNAFLNHDGITWRNIEGEVLANLPLTSNELGEFGGVLLIGQHKMNQLILAELKKYPTVSVRFGLKCVGIDDTPSASTVRIMAHNTASLNDSDILLEAQYILGTDGANSTVRRMMCIPFEGFTYHQFRMIGCDLLLDFHRELGFTPLNFTVHPTNWAVIAYTGQDEDNRPSGSGYRPQWRIAYVEDPNLPDNKEEIMKRAHQRMPAWTKDKKYELTRAEPYRLHQRVAAVANKGRVFLAGDALHSNNPIGGLGLTGGILDACCYGNAFVRVVRDGENPMLLSQCGDARRQAWIDTTNVLSQNNMKRLYAVDEETVRAREAFFQKLNNDPAFPGVIRSGLDGMMTDSFEKKHGLSRHGEMKSDQDAPERIADSMGSVDIAVES